MVPFTQFRSPTKQISKLPGITSQTPKSTANPHHAGLQNPIQRLLCEVQPLLRVPTGCGHRPELRHPGQRPHPRPRPSLLHLPPNLRARLIRHRRRRLRPRLVRVPRLPPSGCHRRRLDQNLRPLPPPHLQPHPLLSRALPRGPLCRLQSRPPRFLPLRLLG